MGKSGPLEGARSANQIQGLGFRSAEKMKEKNKWKVSVKRNARHERISRVASRRRKTGEIPQKRDTIRDHALSLPFSPVL